MTGCSAARAGPPSPGVALGDLVPLRRTGTFALAHAAGAGGDPQGARRAGPRRTARQTSPTTSALACHGLDTHDNDFVIGLVGPGAPPASHLVQTMRRTAQTAEFIQTPGPFFVGHALWRGAAP